MENAVRHGAGIVTVVVEPARLDDEAADRPAEPGADAPLSVRDQGEGISPEVAPRVFRQFWRGKRRGGTGLGLYIVKGLVEAHGGTIGVCSRARRRRRVPIYRARGDCRGLSGPLAAAYG